MLSALFFGYQNENKHLDGAGAGVSAGRVGTDVYAARLATHDPDDDAVADRLLHRFGGGLVVAGMVIYCMLSLHGNL